MTLAFKRLKNLGWLALVCLTAILLYPLSLNVATLHSDLVEIDRDILETQRQIDFLEAELKTRASLDQLEEWNDLLYGYTPPTARQFLAGERALASLGEPAGKRKPVLVAVSSGGVLPAGVVGSGVPVAASGEKPLSKEEQKTFTAAAEEKRAPVVDASQGRTERLAKMEEQLLSEKLLDELDDVARAEGRRR